MSDIKNHVIEAKGLCRNYGKYTALENLDFTIDGPTILGMVGKNGAGKSTLMRLLCGMEKPSAGSITVNGITPYDHGKVLRDIIFIDEKIDFDFMLSIGAVMEKCAFMDERFDLDYARATAERFELPLKKRLSQLSKGMKSQFGIVLGLAFNRPITVMDEPISGLDEWARKSFYKLLVEAQCDNPRIFLISTHLLGEFERHADSFMVINKGKLAAYDKREAFETLFVRVSGAAEHVDAVIGDLETYEQKQLADAKSVTVPNLLSRERKNYAKEHDVDIRYTSIDDACVILGGLGV